MTFQISFDEWMEGKRVFDRSQKGRWWFMSLGLWLGYFFVACLTIYKYLHPAFEHDYALWGSWFWAFAITLKERVWEPSHERLAFRRIYGGDWTRPLVYQFSSEGLVQRSVNGSAPVSWRQIKRRLEGRTVWVFVLKNESKSSKHNLLIFPKRATESEEGRREWAVVDTVFAPPPIAPIAAPL